MFFTINHPASARALCIVGGAVLLAACETTEVRKAAEYPGRSVEPRAELNTQLGVGYLGEGNLELAWKRLHKALEADPQYSPAHNAMGIVYERLNEPANAEAHFKKAVQYDPSNSSAQTNYGSFLCRHGKTQEAEQRFLEAVKNPLYQTPQVAYTNAGVCMKQAGELDKSERYFRKALEFNPRIPVALINMAEIKFETKRYMVARGYLQRYMETGTPTPRALWLGIQIEQALGDKNAVSSYAMLLRNNHPDSPETQLLLESGVQ